MMTGGVLYGESGNLNYHHYAITGVYIVGVIVMTTVFDTLAIWVLRYASEQSTNASAHLHGGDAIKSLVIQQCQAVDSSFL